MVVDSTFAAETFYSEQTFYIELVVKMPSSKHRMPSSFNESFTGLGKSFF